METTEELDLLRPLRAYLLERGLAAWAGLVEARIANLASEEEVALALKRREWQLLFDAFVGQTRASTGLPPESFWMLNRLKEQWEPQRYGQRPLTELGL